MPTPMALSASLSWKMKVGCATSTTPTMQGSRMAHTALHSNKAEACK